MADDDNWTTDDIPEQASIPVDDVVVLEIDHMSVSGAATSGPVRYPGLITTIGEQIGPSRVAVEITPETGAGCAAPVNEEHWGARLVPEDLVVSAAGGFVTDAHQPTAAC
jgi:hypothetical protein